MSKHRKPGPTRLGSILSPKVRRWLYGITATALPIGAAYGLVDDTLVPLWLNLAASVLLTVAIANVDDERGDAPGDER